jgi:Na+/melibiose symporter-like transporter
MWRMVPTEMATPAERIYEAAAAALAAQQESVTRITSTVAPVGTAAAAAALLIKPALVKVDQAGVLQVAGVALGAIGALLVLTAALAVLRGVEMERVEPAKLLASTKSDARMLADGQRFHLEVAETLVKTKTDNEEALKQLRTDFVQMTAGLVTEILGFTLAAALHF